MIESLKEDRGVRYKVKDRDRCEDRFCMRSGYFRDGNTLCTFHHTFGDDPPYKYFQHFAGYDAIYSWIVSRSGGGHSKIVDAEYRLMAQEGGWIPRLGDWTGFAWVYVES